MKISTLFWTLLFSASLAWATDPGEPKKSLPLGSPAPDFKLVEVTSGKTYTLGDFAGQKALLVAFICRHCPYVQHIQKALAALARDYQKKEVALVAISSNDPAAYPDDAPDRLSAMAREEGFTFPFLFDETQDAARAYTARATPDLFLFDAERKLVYRGQFDGTRPGSGRPATGADVRAALDALLEGKPVSPDQKHAVGCSIKWKK